MVISGNPAKDAKRYQEKKVAQKIDEVNDENK